jgi:hypothetical protein
VDRESYNQLVTQFGEKDARATIGNLKVVDGPDSTSLREFNQQKPKVLKPLQPKKKRWFRKMDTVSAFGVEHGETFSKAKGLGSAWQMGSRSRKQAFKAIAWRDKEGYIASRGADKSYLKTIPAGGKATFLASKYRGTLATAGVGAAGGATVEAKRRRSR